ncbi:MAG TPA: DUF1854 domain-containing protein [Noviherbaspirillum sp.]|nr:DUF1854 domain-containing protein [Noviherbaspirillum sp.]
MKPFHLQRNPFGRLVFTSAEGEVHEGVVPVRAFPIAAPDEGLALVSADGRELAWIESLAALPPAARALVEEELASREFLPQIRSIRHVSSFATPSTWEVETDRGDTSFVLKGEEDIRRIAHVALLIADSNGIQYLIKDLQALDKTSRKLLDRFL